MSYLIFGGCGFIGRNLVSHLLDTDTATSIVVVDKMPPAMAWMNEKHKVAFEDDRVLFKAINLLSESGIKKLNELDQTFDFSINCAAETKLGLAREVYEERITKIAENCAMFARDIGVKLHVELSTAQVYGSAGKSSSEDSKTSPKHDFECCKLQAEEAISKISGLQYMILRLGMVYGCGDRNGYITSQLVITSIYSYLDEAMKLIWNKNMYVNTVHVKDTCRAICHLLQVAKPGETYNVVDTGDTTLDTICRTVSQIFEVKHEYLGSLTTMLAAISLRDLAEDVNDKHMSPWSEMCAKYGVSNTPLSPFIYSTQLETLNIRATNDKLLATQFTFEHPGVTLEAFQEVLSDCQELGIFPKLK